ncbi:hypothetical protein BC937DRAFT_88104 [Endogone sp. FLAS-F59071]|nr:hypothetical protein BC937DRAFT_88104 [Endogone sp. FLAS-F59071]|eukprot:RUS22654.1 hypothetical protein BC937DRAFT_88104 [Endogone sp. FLAS-F59071]
MFQNGDETKILSLAEIAIAGSMTGFAIAFVNCPLELLKVKLQTQYGGVAMATATVEAGQMSHKPYKGVIDAGVRTFATYGPRGLYRGIFITICRDIPSFAGYFCILSLYITPLFTA